ncbi:Flp1 family type IVb pilin [Murdochiella massiliensis]|uniref:Flp1 family type IVb pilin n=1 Tax=Murdochiella massiliensis TaxID=1673723 RepID=UPI000833C46F|nr:Flp1 family type IVb pilin [Murdochiella massiliensis]MBY0584915.1 hypothetical protein [Murdochiella sp. Marseille-P8839]
MYYTLLQMLHTQGSRFGEERGEINMVAIVLIILVVIALIAIFRDNLTALLESLFQKIENEAMKI